MPIDLSGFRKKIDAAGGINTVVKNLLQDAGQYMEARIADDVLNGDSGKDYPKSYPVNVSKGSKGFVGVVSGNLKRSIQTRETGNIILVFSDSSAAPVAGYNIYINEWAKDRYGMGYFEIAVELYSGVIEKALIETLTEFARSVGAGKAYRYQNPFPA